MTSHIGKTVDHYHIIEQLGEGGMATVYRAFDMQLERDVAIKFIRKDSIQPKQLEHTLKRFKVEARALAKITHPNIVPIYGFGSYEDEPYLVMAYLPGGTLKDRIGKAMDYQEAISLLIPIADALAYAHEHGVIHRDVKPANILITQGGKPMLSDFGVARVFDSESETNLTNTGVGVGTPGYMAPEQWQGAATPSVDQYALGVMFYEMVAGRKPYTADTPMAVAIKQSKDPLPRAREFQKSIPFGVEKVLMKVLAVDPANRYEDMHAFRRVLEGLAQGKGSNRKVSPWVIVGGLSLVVLILIGIVMISNRPSGNQEQAILVLITETPLELVNEKTPESNNEVTPTVTKKSVVATKTMNPTTAARFATVYAQRTKAAEYTATFTPTAIKLPPIDIDPNVLPDINILRGVEIIQFSKVYNNKLDNDWYYRESTQGLLHQEDGYLVLDFNDDSPELYTKYATISDGDAILVLLNMSELSTPIIELSTGFWPHSDHYTFGVKKRGHSLILESVMGKDEVSHLPNFSGDLQLFRHMEWVYIYLEVQGNQGFIQFWEYGKENVYSEATIEIPDDRDWRFMITGDRGSITLGGYWKLTWK